MARLDLSPTEGEVLKAALESYLSELGMEIADTDSQDYREKLKERREVLKKVLGQLSGVPA